jgi:hypothetical protein
MLDLFPQAWHSFQKKVADARELVRCTKSNAWFRGHGDQAWPLLPTLLRHGGRDETDGQAEVNSIKNAIAQKKATLQEVYVDKTKLNKLMRAATEADRDRYRSFEERANELKRETAALNKKLVRINARVLAERDIFDEYTYRSGLGLGQSSWSVLVEMRHHGVPTRLLDWTDRIDIALYFATRTIKSALSDGGADVYRLSAASVNLVERCPNICVWALNPYAMAKRQAGRFSIVDVGREPELDYYQSFFLRNDWPFDLPLPIFPPAQHTRVEAQKSYFTVQGNRKAPMEVLTAHYSHVLHKIEFSKEEALCAIYYVEVMHGINDFEIFRDKDSLGRQLYRKFLDAQSWKK